MPQALLEQDPVPCFIDGRAYVTAKTFDLVDPHDEHCRVIYRVCAAQQADVDAAIDAASTAFPAWSNTPYVERRKICMKAAALLRERKQLFLDIEMTETTSAKSWIEIHLDHIAVEGLDETACAITHLRGEIAPAFPSDAAFIERVPFGVVLGMAPWNAPLTLGLRAVRDAIFAGNTAVLKASEFSPKVHLAIAQLFADAGLPAGVLNVVHIATADAPQLVERMIARREVAKVNFTGSTLVGSKIAEVCGRHLKPSVMELGGKAPMIVLPSADIDMAAHAAAYGGLLHSGQTCMSTDMLFVHEDVAKKFGAALQEEFRGLHSESTSDFLRGLFHPKSNARIDRLVQDATAKGAEILAGTTDGRKHNITQPLVLQGVTDDMMLSKQETFGPIMGFRTFKSDEEALRLANMSDYGLSSSVYGSDLTHALKIARGIVAGAVHINGQTIHDTGPLPHGGCKASGWGRFNSVEGLREFTFSRSITIDTPHRYR